MVRELDPASALLRPPFGTEPPREDPPADEGEVLELSLEVVVEEVVAYGGDHLPLAAPGKNVEKPHRPLVRLGLRGLLALALGDGLDDGVDDLVCLHALGLALEIEEDSVA